MRKDEEMLLPWIAVALVSVASLGTMLTMLWYDWKQGKARDLDRLNAEYAELIRDEEDRYW